jgi:hypothetical protein
MQVYSQSTRTAVQVGQGSLSRRGLGDLVAAVWASSLLHAVASERVFTGGNINSRCGNGQGSEAEDGGDS